MKEKPIIEPVNFASIAKGALVEMFEMSIPWIARNIADTTTPATKDRELVLRIKFKPDADRRGMDITSTVECKLASVAKHSSRAFIGKDTNGNVLVFAEDPRQEMLFDPPPKQDSLLEFRSTAT